MNYALRLGAISPMLTTLVMVAKVSSYDAAARPVSRLASEPPATGRTTSSWQLEVRADDSNSDKPTGIVMGLHGPGRADEKHKHWSSSLPLGLARLRVCLTALVMLANNGVSSLPLGLLVASLCLTALVMFANNGLGVCLSDYLACA